MSASPRLPPIVNGFHSLTEDLIVQPRRQGNQAAVRLRRSTMGSEQAKDGAIPTIEPTHSVAESTPKEDPEKGTITQSFRMLSAVFIPGHCTDFYTEGKQLFTEKNLPLFTDTTLYANHGEGFWSPPRVQNWLGKAVNARISDRIALGVDADFVISLEQDAILYSGAIARGLKFSPPAVDSASVTIWFTHRRSHPDLDDFEFYWKLGTIVDGQVVRFIVESILRIPECSLVYAGADALARSFSLQEARPTWNGDAAPVKASVPMSALPAVNPAVPVSGLQLQAALHSPPVPSVNAAAGSGKPLAPRIAMTEEQTDNPRWHNLYLLYEIGEVLALGPDLEERAGDDLKPKVTAALDTLAELAPVLLAAVRAAPSGQSPEEENEEGEEDAEKAEDAAAVTDEDLSTLAAALAVADRTQKGKLLRQRSFRAKRAPEVRQALSFYRYARLRFGNKDASQLVLAVADLAVKAETPKTPKQTPAERRSALMALARQKGIPPVALVGHDKMGLDLLSALVNGHPGTQSMRAPASKAFASSAHPRGAAAAEQEARGGAPTRREDVELTAADRRRFRAMGITDEAKMRSTLLSLNNADPKQLANGMTDDDSDDDSDDSDDDE